MLLWDLLVCPGQGPIYSAAHSKLLTGGAGTKISLFSPSISPHLNLPSSVVFAANTFPNWLFAFYSFSPLYLKNLV